MSQRFTVLLTLGILVTGCAESRPVHDAGPGSPDSGPGSPDAGPGSLDAGQPDPQEICINQLFWMCRRDFAAERTTEAEYMDCLVPIESACTGAAWPADCTPSMSAIDTCIVELSRADLFDVPTDELLATGVCDLCL